MYTLDEIKEMILAKLEIDTIHPLYEVVIQDSKNAIGDVMRYANKVSNNDYAIDELPMDLYWIVENMVLVAFNRMGSEGMSSHNEGGEVITFRDNGRDWLLPFRNDISDWVMNENHHEVIAW